MTSKKNRELKIMVENYIMDEENLLEDQDSEQAYNLYEHMLERVRYLGVPLLDVKDGGSASDFYDFLMTFNVRRKVIADISDFIDEDKLNK